ERDRSSTRASKTSPVGGPLVRGQLRYPVRSHRRKRPDNPAPGSGGPGKTLATAPSCSMESSDLPTFQRGRRHACVPVWCCMSGSCVGGGVGGLCGCQARSIGAQRGSSPFPCPFRKG